MKPKNIIMKKLITLLVRPFNWVLDREFLSNPDVRAFALGILVFLFGFLMGMLCLKAKLGI